jgi:hypothetical protein
MKLEDRLKSLILSFEFLFLSKCGKQILWVSSMSILKAPAFPFWHACLPLLATVVFNYAI